MNKTIVSLNFLWIVVATGTFYAGSVWREGLSSGDGVAGKRPENTVSGGMSSPEKSQRQRLHPDDALDDFFARHGLTEGMPLSPEAMGRAISEALRETDPIKSQMLFGRLMSALTPGNAPAALAMIRENTSGFESMRYLNMLAYAWGGVDPKAAMEQLAGPGERGGRLMEGTALTGWAAKDPAAAKAWLESYQGQNRQDLTQFLINGLAKSDFAAALSYAGGLENKDDRNRAAQALAREMIRTGGVEGASAWLASLTDPAMKAGAFDTVAQQLLRSDPEQAAAFILKNAGADYAAGTAATYAADLSRKDLPKGLEFAASLTGSAQSQAYSEIIRQWMGEDKGAKAAEASEFVNQMPAGPARDAGAAMIAREVSREDPAASIAWAGTISDSAQREQLLVQAGRRYLRTNPEAGATWLAQSGLSPEAQQQITAPRQERAINSAAEDGAGVQRPNAKTRNNQGRRQDGNGRNR